MGRIILLFLSPKVLTYPLILGNIKSYGLTTSFKYQIKYLELFFILNNFGITMLSTPISKIFISFFGAIKFFICCFCLIKSQHYLVSKNFLSLSLTS